MLCGSTTVPTTIYNFTKNKMEHPRGQLEYLTSYDHTIHVLHILSNFKSTRAYLRPLGTPWTARNIALMDGLDLGVIGSEMGLRWIPYPERRAMEFRLLAAPLADIGREGSVS